MVLCGNHLKKVKYTALASGRVSDVAVVHIDKQKHRKQVLKYSILIEFKEQQIYQVIHWVNFYSVKEGTRSYSKLKNTAWRTLGLMNYKGRGKFLITLGRRHGFLMTSGWLEDSCALCSFWWRSGFLYHGRQNNGSPRRSIPDSRNLWQCDLTWQKPLLEVWLRIRT